MRPERAPLAAVTLTFREAPTSVRARAAERIPDDAMEALRQQGVRGIVEAHTCARSLWLISAENAAWAGALVQSHVASRLGGEVLPQNLVGEDAFRHALRVAIGLESPVEGEGDIGNQLATAFASGQLAERSCAVLNLLQQSCARVVSVGRTAGFVRPMKGLGALSVAVMEREGVTRSEPVAVVGGGVIGRRVHDALRRAGYADIAIYNRTPRPDCHPLSLLSKRVFAGIIVCTAGPTHGIDAKARVVIDLGVPAQVAGPTIGLDALLSGPGLRLSGEARALAELAVERELTELFAKTRGLQARRAIGHTQDLRDRFVSDRLDAIFGPALDDLSPAQRKRVLEAARGAIRHYNHEVVTWLRGENDGG